MARIISSLVLAVCTILVSSQPVEKLPVLAELPASLLFKESNEPQNVVKCVTEGQEEGVKYTWLKNGEPLPAASSNDGTLVLNKPSQSDEGRYQCRAESDLGVASSRVITIKRTFIDIPKVSLNKHKPVEGKPFKLDCQIPNAYPKPTIEWQFQSLSDPSASRTILDKRITLSPDGTLWFSNVTKEDTNNKFKYVCVAKSPAVANDVPLAEHVIEDIVPNSGAQDGELVLQYVTTDFTAKVGDVTMIYCIYGGTPLAHPDWYKDGKNTNNSPKDRVTRYNRTAGKRLLIKETWLEDRGTYTCIVDNEVGKPQEHTIHLDVVSAPDFIKRPENKAIIKEGQDITIPCQVAGVPAPKLSWTFNAKDLASNERFKINQSTQGNVTVADLTIKNVQKNDKGYYGCRGINDNGEVYAESLVYVQ